MRQGNPHAIHDWDDLAKPGLNVLTPNVRTSGGAMWNIAAIFGAVMRGKTSAEPTKAGVLSLLKKILANVSVMDKGARESLITFEQGVGDVAITYENEVLAAKRAGRTYDYVVPKSTILIENPVAVVDVYAAKHKTSDIAQAFVDFLTTPDARPSTRSPRGSPRTSPPWRICSRCGTSAAGKPSTPSSSPPRRSTSRP